MDDHRSCGGASGDDGREFSMTRSRIAECETLRNGAEPEGL